MREHVPSSLWRPSPLAHCLCLFLAALLASAFAARAQTQPNFLYNSSFHSGLSYWSVVSGLPIQVSATWQSVDAIGAAKSGSVRTSVPNLPSGADGVVLRTCVSVSGGIAPKFSLSLKFRTNRLDYSGPVAQMVFHADSNCNGQVVGSAPLDPVRPLLSGWQTAATRRDAPATTRSVSIQLHPLQANAPTVLEIDDVFFQSSAGNSICTPTSQTLCLDDQPGDRRFAVLTGWSHGENSEGYGQAVAIPGVARGGLFWFFSQDNPELLVKVLNGCALNHRYWVFLSAGTNVSVSVLILDRVSGAWVLYANPDDSPMPAVQDVLSFPCGG